jgi:hypothetical protein
MRTSRGVTAGSAALLVAAAALVAGCGMDLISRGKPSDYLPAVHVTGKVLDWNDADEVETQRWEASDPRLTGDLEFTARSVHFGPATGGVANALVTAGVYAVDTVEGHWSGTSTEVWVEVPEFSSHIVLLTGEGAYEGLSAYLVVDIGRPWNYDDRTFTGLIFPDKRGRAPWAWTSPAP